jgi:hypothetical protein
LEKDPSFRDAGITRRPCRVEIWRPAGSVRFDIRYPIKNAFPFSGKIPEENRIARGIKKAGYEAVYRG